MKGVNITAILLLLTFGCLLVVPAIDAVTVTKDESYSSTDTVLPVYDGGARFYYIEATDDYDIKYSVTVVGSGTVQAFLAKGRVSFFSYEMEYYVMYSTDENTKEVEETMPVWSGEGDEFTLVVITEEDESVTYDIEIEVIDDAISDLGFIMMCVSAVVIVIVIIAVIVILFIRQHRKDKKLHETAARQAAQYQYPAQPQYATTAQQLYGGTDAYASQQPQYPGYPPQQPRQPY